MKENFKAVLLTILTLSVFVIAIVELTGVSTTAIVNKYGHKEEVKAGPLVEEKTGRSKEVNEMPRTTMAFEEMKHDFGVVTEGEVVKHTFKFKNTGANPLMIAKADVSCGCTVASFSKEPIAPGGSGELAIEFNTSGKGGMQKKNILVHSNANPEAVSISIEANVK